MLQSTVSSVETRTSWVVASMILVVMAIAFGAPWITVVALKDIAAEVNGERSVPAFASALMWIGSGVGGILMGRIAERIGVRWTVMFGAAMIAVGLALSSLGPSWPLYIGHGLFIGLIGIGGINAPSYVYVSRWFDRRRGSALALISSGAYLAGAIWPPIFRARDRVCRLAAYDAVLRRLRASHHRAGRGDIPGAAAGRAASHAARSRRAQTKIGHGLAAEFCFWAADVRDLHLLHSDVDAARPSRGVLHRSRHQRRARRGHGVGSPRRGFFQPAGLGRDLRPDRRALYDARRLGLPGIRYVRVSLDAERGRIVHRCGAVRDGLFRSGSRQHSGVARNVSGQRRLLADADAAICAAALAWRRAAGSPA